METEQDNSTALRQLENAITETLSKRLTEDKVALIFTKKYANKLIYSHQHGYWFEWQEPGYWRKEETLFVPELIRRLVRSLRVDDTQRVSSSKFIQGVEKLCRMDRVFAVHGNKLDRNPYLLNTPFGTFDLRTGTKKEHDPSDLLT